MGTTNKQINIEETASPITARADTSYWTKLLTPRCQDSRQYLICTSLLSFILAITLIVCIIRLHTDILTTLILFLLLMSISVSGIIAINMATPINCKSPSSSDIPLSVL